MMEKEQKYKPKFQVFLGKTDIILETKGQMKCTQVRQFSTNSYFQPPTEPGVSVQQCIFSRCRTWRVKQHLDDQSSMVVGRPEL